MRDLEQEIEDLKIKGKRYMEQYATERNKNIDQELEITKKHAEIIDLKNKRNLLETTINDLEISISEQKKLIEDFQEKEDFGQSLHNTEIAFAPLDDDQSLFDLPSFMNRDSIRKSRRNEKLAEEESEKELMEKDIELLIEKCKTIQKEYEEYRLKTEEDIIYLSKQNENLRHEVRIPLSLTNSGSKPTSLLLSSDNNMVEMPRRVSETSRNVFTLYIVIMNFNIYCIRRLTQYIVPMMTLNKIQCINFKNHTNQSM